MYNAGPIHCVLIDKDAYCDSDGAWHRPEQVPHPVDIFVSEGAEDGHGERNVVIGVEAVPER